MKTRPPFNDRFNDPSSQDSKDPLPDQLPLALDSDAWALSPQVRERVSELMDARPHTPAGLAPGDELAAWASRHWQDDEVREAWGVYHLIGDVMRSDELAHAATQQPMTDAAFVATLRERLKQEPVVLAPTSAPASESTRGPALGLWVQRWNAVAAVAGVAAVAAVAGVLWMSQPPPAQMEALGEPATRVVDSALIRDAKLDQYLRAHRGGPVALPGGPTGRFETVVLEKK